MTVKQVFNTSAELDFPNVLPTLDLDFANSKTLDPRITFTRSSGGSYVGADGLIKYAGVNEARFDHDPSTGESLGLLVEESRTNLALDGTTFANPNWLKSKINLDTLSFLSPDNSLTAAKMYPNTESGQHNIVRTITGLSDNTVYTSSIFIKKFGSYPWCRLSLRSKDGTFTGVYFNYDTKTFGTVITIGGLVSYGYQEYSNGWIRLYIVTNTSTGAITPTFHFWIAASNGALDFDYTGGNSDGYYIWGAQLEQGSFPTSYIPTQGSTRTRAADNAQITGKNFSEWYRQDEGTIYSSFKFIDNTRDTDINGFGKAILNFIDNSQTERIRFATSALGNSISTIWISNSITQATLNSGPYDKNKEISVSSSYKTNNFALSRNNSQQTLKSSVGKVPININTLHIGRSTSAFGYISGTIRRITYYPKALSPSNLQSLTS
jgi:hypothetical protein